MRTALAALVLALLFALPRAASSAAPRWADLAGEREIVAVVHKPDGTPREVTIWLAVLDGQGYIRTRNTSWRADLERDPRLSLRVAGTDYPVRVSAVTDEALRERVNAAFSAKYGRVPHIFLSIMRPIAGPWNIYRAVAR